MEAELLMQINNPEAAMAAEIERLELDARNVRRRVEHVRNEEDKRVLNKQLHDLREQIDLLREQLK